MSPAAPSATRIPWLPFLAYGSGNIACCVLGYGVGGLANYVFNIGLGVDPVLIGLALALPRAVDLITDPVVGYLSDRFAARWGRRSFIGVGSVFGAIFFTAIWMFPPNLTATGYFLWLLGFSCATYVALSVVQVPLQALGFELTADPNERTRLMAISLSLGSAAGIAIGWAYAASRWDIFSDPAQGTRWVGVSLGVLILVSGIFSARFARMSGVADGAKKIPETSFHLRGWREFSRSIRRVMSCRPFRILAAMIASMCLGVFSISSLNPYIGIYYVCGGDLARGAILVGAATMVYQIVSLLLGPVVSRIASRWGKKSTLLFFLGLAFAGNLAKWFCYTPARPWLFAIPAGTLAAAFAAVWTITPALVADICDDEERRTGVRDGGMFAALYGWTIKAGGTVAFLLSGVLLSLTGFDVVNAALQSETVLWRMRWMDFALPGVSAALAFWLVAKFPERNRG
ncbi:MFS transporter [Oleiharenicola lentus]|uniref:MFS transporter n=1 Tax=Oleiharenicola lentus TaxID=2508720 RepID=UPI003F6670CA